MEDSITRKQINKIIVPLVNIATHK